MKRDVTNLLVAGLVLATVEVVATVVRGHALFLSLGEQLFYALTALAAACSAVLAIGLVLRAVTGSVAPSVAEKGPSGSAFRALGTVRREGTRAGRAALAVSCAALGAFLFWELTAGRRVHAAAWRLPGVAMLALLSGAGGFLWLEHMTARRAGSRLARGPLLIASVFAWAALLLSVYVLPRSYPAFHVGLALLALASLSSTALLAPVLLPARYVQRAPLAAAALVLLAPWCLFRVAHHPTLSFALREKAPWSARLIAALVPAPRRAKLTARAAAMAPVQSQRGVDLRDRDVLLISVDALRADLLRAYGGRGRTKEIDRLAAESTVFLRAYTPAPHTSYALASMLTGKFVKPLVELGQKLGDPPTLPDRLRRLGYRTAAFYPPAIFFVDGASFEPLQQRGFGFEYRKEMFASADERIEQLSAYLAEADPKRPLFVWVHLFEPHEPYDPPAASLHDGSERGRYEAEVESCDRAIAELVRRFRSARPSATVIVTADHGEEFGDHGGSFHGTSLYDEQVRIPLLWSSPGVVAARTSSVPVELTDIGTTILSTAGIPRDAHMRGDDLGAVLAGRDEAGPLFAFASIDARHMVTDGKHKLICGNGEAYCALFDLERDPTELHNLAGSQAARVERLRAELDAFLSSISRTEAVTVSQGVSLPEVLARAKLGATIHVDELLPLLANPQASVRSESARALGELGQPSARAAVRRARLEDDDRTVRSEAAIAALSLGDDEAVDAVITLLAAPPAKEGIGQARRAALALARVQRSEAVPVLASLALDEQATESDRLRAVRALGALGSPLALEPLIATLSVVRLREASAHALAQLGDERAIGALREQLAQERYAPARAAEAAALRTLGDPALAPLVRHFLGMESSLPRGVRLLAELGELTPAGRAGALLADARVRVGDWTCAPVALCGAAPSGVAGTSAEACASAAAVAMSNVQACAPHARAQLALPPSNPRARGPSTRGSVRVTLWFRAEEQGAALIVDGQRWAVSPAEEQLSFERTSRRSAERLSIAREGQVTLLGVAVVDAVAEIPPPPPEPWESDAGADGSTPVR